MLSLSLGLGLGPYKKYIDELTAIFDASNEIIYLCNNFDITRIHNLFINIIETYNYYEDGKNKISDTDLLSNDISESLEYKKMKEYIDNNFKKIQDKWDCLLLKLESLKSNLNYIDPTDDNDDKLIKDNFKSQYKTIRINLEDIERELIKIKTLTELEIKAIKEDAIQFDIYPITKNSMIFKSTFYSWFKKIFKNLQIINSDESEVEDEELEKNKKNFFKLYKNLIEKFNKDTITTQESEIKVIIVDLKKQEEEFKTIYDSFIKTGGDGKGVDEDDGEGGKGEDGNGEGGNAEGIKKIEDKNEDKDKDKDKDKGSGEVKRLEETAERLKKEAEEAKKKAEKLKEESDAANSNLKEGANEEDNLILTKKALDAATAMHNAALEASDAKKKADNATKAAATAVEEEANKKAKEAEEAKKKAAEAAAEAKKKAEAEEKKKKEAEDAKKKEDDAAAGAAGVPVDEKVFNFEYNNNSCYVNSALQMLIDNDEVCDKIISLANKKLGEKFKDNETDKDKESDEYLLYLLNNIILYHKGNRHSVGEAKKPSYNEYILPLREYLIKKDTSYDFNEFGDCGIIFNYILQKLQNLQIENNYYTITKALDRKYDTTSLETLIDDDGSIGNNINIIINIIRSQTKKDKDDKALLTQNNQVIYESSKKPIILPHSLSLSNTKYNLKGFIHHIDRQHFVYYKFLNNTKGEWVLLDDYDAINNDDDEHIPPLLDSSNKKILYNDTDSVRGKVLGNNGKIIKEEELPTDGSVLIYYKKDVNALNATPVARVEELLQDDENLKKAIAASLEQPVAGPVEPQPVEVANTTVTPFKYKYSFEKVGDIVSGNTPIYNSNKPYLNSTKNKNANFMASLNAGDAGMYIGGSAINAGFEKDIQNYRYENGIKLSPITDLYISAAKMHLLCYLHMYEINDYDIKINSSEFKTEGGGMPLEKYFEEINEKAKLSNAVKFKKFVIGDTSILKSNTFKEVYLYISSKKPDESVKFLNNLYPGDVFIDVFRDEIDILNNKANRAMIYCVGPDGGLNGVSETIFLATLNIVGENIANAINEYNKLPENKDKKIDYVRICLISGNVFLPNSMKEKGNPIPSKQELVAEALIKGINSVNIVESKLVNNIVYNFAYAGGVFQKAFDKLKETDATLASAELIIT